MSKHCAAFLPFIVHHIVTLEFLATIRISNIERMFAASSVLSSSKTFVCSTCPRDRASSKHALLPIFVTSSSFFSVLIFWKGISIASTQCTDDHTDYQCTCTATGRCKATTSRSSSQSSVLVFSSHISLSQTKAASAIIEENKYFALWYVGEVKRSFETSLSTVRTVWKAHFPSDRIYTIFPRLLAGTSTANLPSIGVLIGLGSTKFILVRLICGSEITKSARWPSFIQMRKLR